MQSFHLIWDSTNVLVVLPDIHSNANCFVLSELSLTLNPLSFVTTAVEVIEANPVNVVALAPKATAVLPMLQCCLLTEHLV